jgi:hypothetical protein
MKGLIESLSLGSAAVLIAILSAGIVWFLCAVWPRHYKVFWVVIVPLALSNCLYWSQAWLDVHHGSRSQYEQAVIWSPLKRAVTHCEQGVGVEPLFMLRCDRSPVMLT